MAEETVAINVDTERVGEGIPYDNGNRARSFPDSSPRGTKEGANYGLREGSMISDVLSMSRPHCSVLN